MSKTLSQSQINFIIDYYPTTPISTIAKSINKSTSGIRNYVKIYNLQKTKNNNPDYLFADIPNFEGKYQATSCGKIWAVNKSIFLKSRLDRYGYPKLGLFENSKYQKSFTVHRLIALSFISNPNNYPQINHIDGNKQNNCVKNLEWCNESQNKQHAFSIGITIAKKGRENHMFGRGAEKHTRSKPVVAYNLDGTLYKEYSCTVEAEKDGFKRRQISSCCLGKSKTAYGRIWKRLEISSKEYLKLNPKLCREYLL